MATTTTTTTATSLADLPTEIRGMIYRNVFQADSNELFHNGVVRGADGNPLDLVRASRTAQRNIPHQICLSKLRLPKSLRAAKMIQEEAVDFVLPLLQLDQKTWVIELGFSYVATKMNAPKATPDGPGRSPSEYLQSVYPSLYRGTKNIKTQRVMFRVPVYSMTLPDLLESHYNHVNAVSPSQPEQPRRMAKLQVQNDLVHLIADASAKHKRRLPVDDDGQVWNRYNQDVPSWVLNLACRIEAANQVITRLESRRQKGFSIGDVSEIVHAFDHPPEHLLDFCTRRRSVE